MESSGKQEERRPKNNWRTLVIKEARSWNKIRFLAAD
jgi:hypothetical protein